MGSPSLIPAPASERAELIDGFARTPPNPPMIMVIARACIYGCLGRFSVIQPRRGFFFDGTTEREDSRRGVIILVCVCMRARMYI